MIHPTDRIRGGWRQGLHLQLWQWRLPRRHREELVRILIKREMFCYWPHSGTIGLAPSGFGTSLFILLIVMPQTRVIPVNPCLILHLIFPDLNVWMFDVVSLVFPVSTRRTENLRQGNDLRIILSLMILFVSIQYTGFDHLFSLRWALYWRSVVLRPSKYPAINLLWILKTR